MPRIPFGRALTLLGLLPLHAAFAGAPTDSAWKTMMTGVDSVSLKGVYAGRLTPVGENAFALVADKENRVCVAAGYFQDDTTKGRVVAFGHDGLPGRAPGFLKNAATWCAKPGAKIAVLGDEEAITTLGKAGFAATVAREPSELADADLIYLKGSAALADAGTLAAIEAHLKKGKGLVLAVTTWAQSEADSPRLEALLRRCGLHASGYYEAQSDYSQKRAPSPLLSVSHAAGALATGKLSAKETATAARTLESALDLDPRPPRLDTLLAGLSKRYGRIAPSLENPYMMNRDPLADLRLAADMVEAGKAGPAATFVHPAAKSFPGLCGPGAPVTRDITFRAASPADSAYVNDSGHGTWIETGLYADAGRVITIRIPKKCAGKGIRAVIGIHEDRLWRSDNAAEKLVRFPDITRDIALDAAETRIGTPFGGLVRLYVKPGVDLGDITATVSGAVEAPVFELSKTTPAEWSRQRAKPGAWGYIRTPLFTAYVPRESLTALGDPTPIARHWQRVMSLADEWTGYAKWRRRPETAVQDIQITVGLHHAGYPLMLGGDDRNLLLAPTLPTDGDWGVYHEIGHGYQSCFKDGYTIATHAEVDVNLVPGIAYYHLHGRTAWDGPTHDTYDGKSREDAMRAFLALPKEAQTWTTACESPVAYDFHFGLAEAFGWKVWKTALGRLIAFHHDEASDAELAALTEGDEDQRCRDRMLVCLSAASGYNLTPWFNRYGLGEFPLGAKAVATIAKLPAWAGNRPVESIQGPAEIKTGATKPGAILATYTAADPDPGQTFEWDISSGNEDGALRIDKRTGALSLVKPLAAGRPITLRVRDCGVPRYGKTKDVRVE